MSKKPGAKQVAQGAVDRLRASKIFFSGELDAQRAQALSKGDAPWRILRYQRIVEPEKLGYPIAKQQYTRPATFENHLKYLQRHCRVVSLDALCQQIASGEDVPDKTVAITMDGGWIDNFVYAYPALLRAQIPATFFLATGFVNTMDYFWQEKLMFALLIMKEAQLKFIPFDFLNEEERQLLLEVSPEYAIDFPLILTLTALLEEHPLEDRQIAVQTLGSVAHRLGGAPPVEPAFMSWETAKMCIPQLISFGSWSHARNRFDELDEEGIRIELRASYETLRANFENVSSVFSFPEGYVPYKTLPLLAEFQITAAVGLDNVPTFKEKRFEIPVYPRVALCEGNSYSTEVFACKLWLRP